MDKALVMDKLFKFLKDFPEFKELSDIHYDEAHDLVRARIGVVNKVIPINDKTSWIAIVTEVLNWFARE